jgi:sodium/potassium-transporting ATPase subunit alpha
MYTATPFGIESMSSVLCNLMYTLFCSTYVCLLAGTSNQLSKIAAAASGEPAPTSLQVEIVRFVKIIAALAITTGVITVTWWAAWLNVEHPGFMTSGSMMYVNELIVCVPCANV